MLLNYVVIYIKLQHLDTDFNLKKKLIYLKKTETNYNGNNLIKQSRRNWPL